MFNLLLNLMEIHSINSPESVPPEVDSTEGDSPPENAFALWQPEGLLDRLNLDGKFTVAPEWEGKKSRRGNSR